MAAPAVQSLQNIAQEYTNAFAPSLQNIDEQSNNIVSAGQIGAQKIEGQKNIAFGDITAQAGNRGALFSGFTPDAQAKYTANTYLPALAGLQQSILESRTALNGQKAGITTNINNKSIDTRTQQQSILQDWQNKQDQFAFTAGEGAKDRSFQSGEAQKTRGFQSGEAQKERGFQREMSKLSQDFETGKIKTQQEFQARQSQLERDFTAGQNSANRAASAYNASVSASRSSKDGFTAKNYTAGVSKDKGLAFADENGKAITAAKYLSGTKEGGWNSTDMAQLLSSSGTEWDKQVLSDLGARDTKGNPQYSQIDLIKKYPHIFGN